MHWRWQCPKFVRQTFVEWAGQTINKSFWAGVYYRQQCDKGSSHQAAVRALAFKWIRILYRCWQTGTPYDESTYLNALRQRGSPCSNSFVQLRKTLDRLPQGVKRPLRLLECSHSTAAVGPGGRDKRDLQAGLGGKALQFDLPQARAVTVAAATVGTDEQTLGARIKCRAHRSPPAANTLSGEGGSIVIEAHIHPAQVLSDVVHAIGNRLTSLGSMKSCTRTFSGFPCGCHFRPALW